MEVTYEVREELCSHCDGDLYAVVRVAGDSVVQMGRPVRSEADAAAYRDRLIAADDRVRRRKAEARTALETQSAKAIKLPYIPPDEA